MENRVPALALAKKAESKDRKRLVWLMLVMVAATTLQVGHFHWHNQPSEHLVDMDAPRIKVADTTSVGASVKSLPDDSLKVRKSTVEIPEQPKVSSAEVSFPSNNNKTAASTKMRFDVLARQHAPKPQFPVNFDRSGKSIDVLRDPSELEASHHPRLWIYVSSWDEGMSSWLQSISQILAMTRKLNAIFVVPCVMKGRLYSCNNTDSDTLACNNTDSDTLVQLGEFLDLSLMKEFYPRLVSYDQFQQEMIWQPPSVWTRTCMHIGNPPAAQLCKCKGASVSYMQSSNEQLETAAAASVNGNAVLEIIAYRKGAISKLQYRGVALLERNDDVAIKASYLRFNPKHYSYVDDLLKNMGVDKDSFSVIHWRAEKSNIDYLDCAQEIIKTRSLMENTVNVSKFVLMSSLNTNEDLMWTGARKMASNSTSKDALKLMLASGFQKLDTVIDSNALVDSGLLAVWDLIVATKATKFATCTRGCKKKMCQKCNHLGGFAVFALQLREVANKTSNSCWPE